MSCRFPWVNVRFLCQWLIFGGYFGCFVTSASGSHSDATPQRCQPDDVMITSAVRALVTSGDCLKGCPPDPEEGDNFTPSCRRVGGRCLPVVSPEDLLRLYDFCLPQDPSGQDCRYLSGRQVIVETDCLPGEIRDPCDVIDTNVSTISLRHHWTFPSSTTSSPSPSSADSRQQCTCSIASLTGDPQSFTFRGVSVSAGGGAGVAVWDPRVYMEVSRLLPPSQPLSPPASSHFTVRFGIGSRPVDARQMLTVVASNHQQMRVVCGKPADSQEEQITTTENWLKAQTETEEGERSSGSDVKAQPTSDVTYTPMTEIPTLSENDNVTFSLTEFFLGLVSVSAFLILLIVVITRLRHRGGSSRSQPQCEIPPQRFSVIRSSNPANRASLYHTPQLQSAEQSAGVPGSPAHHYMTLPHNQKRPSTEGTSQASAYASTPLYPVRLQRTMSLPADTPRPPAPTHSPPPPPISASLTAIMNHVSRLENIRSVTSLYSRAGPGEGGSAAPLSGAGSRLRLRSEGDGHCEWNNLFSCSSSAELREGEEEEDYESAYAVMMGENPVEKRC